MIQPEQPDIYEAFRRAFGGEPTSAVRAPGRVNLIGEHTDYNDGFVLPMAIERDVRIALRPRSDTSIVLRSVNFDEQVEFAAQSPSDKGAAASWSDYVRGVAWAMGEKDIQLRGMDAAIAGDVPIGAGLSSSAAIEVAAAWALQTAGGFRLDPVQMALLCQRAENAYVGVNSGIMDQYISALGQKGHALLIDCRSLSYQPVPLPDEYAIVICNSMVRRGLVDSAYNERRAQCEEGVRLLQQALPGIRALRDVSVDELEQHRDLLPEIVYRRCRHVVMENARVLESVVRLKAGDSLTFGRLMNASHESLRDDYEVSCAELNMLVEIATGAPGCLGARLTGAGFGGCTVNLVDAAIVDAFVARVADEYSRRSGLQPEVYVSRAADGAGPLPFEVT